MKYISKKITHDGRTFDSKKEGERYLELRQMEREGLIGHFECQPVFKFFAGQNQITGLYNEKQRVYTADFAYFTTEKHPEGKRRVIEEVKPRKKATAKNGMKKDKALIDAASSLRISVCEAIYGKVDIIY